MLSETPGLGIAGKEILLRRGDSICFVAVVVTVPRRDGAAPIAAPVQGQDRRPTGRTSS